MSPLPRSQHPEQQLQLSPLPLLQKMPQVAEYQRCLLAYQERRAALREPLVEAEAARLAAEEASAAAAAARRQGGMLGWLGAALGAPEPQAPPQRSEHQRRVLARAAVERRLDAELGPPPAAPPAPKGVYLHGSVGSGKSLVMDLLSAAVHAEQAVTHHRRLHFNAALLELHRWAGRSCPCKEAALCYLLQVLFHTATSFGPLFCRRCLPRSRMHALESHRVSREQRQMESYAAAVLEQQQRDREGGAAAGGEGGDSGMDSGAEGGSSAWRDILRLDPVAQKLRRSKLARIAFRR